MAATVEQALVARLKAVPAVNDEVGGAVFTATDTQDGELPLIVVTKLGAEGAARLDGGRALKRYTLQADVYATTELEAQTIGAAVREAVAPTGAPWRDVAAGVHGALFEDSTGGVTEDGYRIQTETFGVWFQPT